MDLKAPWGTAAPWLRIAAQDRRAWTDSRQKQEDAALDNGRVNEVGAC